VPRSGGHADAGFGLGTLPNLLLAGMLLTRLRDVVRNQAVRTGLAWWCWPSACLAWSPRRPSAAPVERRGVPLLTRAGSGTLSPGAVTIFRGMSCAACRAPRESPQPPARRGGQVNFATGKARLTAAPDAADADMLAAIRKAGFDVAPRCSSSALPA
jgi:hypothetical protein